jgi:putative glutamine amidotransferase
VTTAPRIGVTGPDRGGAAAWLLTAAAIRRAGGHPVRFTPSNRPADARIDGLVLGGGADVDPALYQERASALGEVIRASADAARAGRTSWRSKLYAPALYLLRRVSSRRAGTLDPGRDTLERELLALAVARDLPILGICRGAQLFNVHFGGTLYADLREFYEETPQLRTMLPRKPITIEPSSRLAALLGTTRCRVNAIHRQAIRTVGAGLTVVAREATGVVQAIEQPEHRYRIGVQWHPEYIPQHRSQRGLFEGLVAAAT